MQNLKAIFLVSWLLVFFVAAYGQKKEKAKPDAFADVPAHLRAPLVERLNLLIEYQRAREWSKVYDLLGEQFKQSIEGGLSRERYLETHPRSRLVKFTPKSATLLLGTQEDGWWMITGCGEYSRTGLNQKMESSVDACCRDGEWFFSDVDVQFPCIHCEPKGCRH